MTTTGNPGGPPAPRRFGGGRRPASVQVHKDHGFQSNQRFQTLPSPTGPYPYRLSLGTVLPADQMKAIADAGQLCLHCVGDTGGIKSPQPQQIVALTMENDYAVAPHPSFFYHLGDVVYYNGQKSEYYPQFYEPYVSYPAPILGIPGNHDGDPLNAAAEPSLAGFAENFCATRPYLTPEAQDTHRDAMTQPNVYWTLVAPYLTLI